MIRNLLRNRWFLLGLVVKFVFLFYGGSEYFEKLFIPFLDSAVTHLGQNPWDLLPTHYFPYGSVLFTILFIPKLILHALFGDLALGGTFLSFFSIKFLLLIFDFLLFIVLCNWAPQREHKLVMYYWLNPVLFYISYIHGQLDVFSMFFSVLSILMIVRGKNFWSALAISLAVLCKFHTVILIPFILAYVWSTQFRKQGILNIAQYIGTVLVLVAVGFIPQLLTHKMGYVSVGSPEALTIFGSQLRVDHERVLYLGFLLTTAVLARLCMSTRITSEGVFYGAGIIFGALILGTAAMPGWYFWFLPFVAVFYSTRSLVFHSLLFLFYSLYFFHFALQGFYPESYKELLGSVSFSVLQLSVLGLFLSIWAGAIRLDAPLIRRTRPLLIGLAGNSGSGKNSLTDIIQDLFGLRSATVIEGDDYHKWERGHGRWKDYTHLNPKANFLDEMADHTRALMTGRLVYQPHYDHSTGKFTLPRPIETTKNLIVQGLHTFYLVSLRNQFDIKIYMAPDEELRTAWKVLRDVNHRGHSLEKVMDSIRSRDLDSVMHINPQRKLADWVVEFKLKAQGTFDYATLKESPSFFVRHIVWNDTPVNRLVESLAKYPSVKASIELNPESIDQVIVNFDGTLTKEQVQAVALDCFDHIRHLTRSDVAPKWRENQDGFMQLVALSLIERQMITKGMV